MPKIFKYLNIIMFFYANEHKPIHVHGKTYGGNESKAEIIIKNGEFVEIRIKKVKGRNPLKKKDMANFKKFVEAYREQIVNKWIDFFVMGIEMNMEEIEEL